MGKNAKDYRVERDIALAEVERLKKIAFRKGVVHLLTPNGEWSYCGSIGSYGKSEYLLRTNDINEVTCRRCLQFVEPTLEDKE